MINLANQKPLTVNDRKRIVNRALNAIPFIHYLPYEVQAEAQKRSEYKTVSQIETDFFVTEMRANFGEVFTAINSKFNLNVFEQFTGQSLYGFNRSQSLPAGMLTTECREATVVANQIYDDRQSEWMPRLVRAGSTIIAEITNVDDKIAPVEAGIGLCGFQLLQHPYLNALTMERINRSLSTDTVYQTFRVKVDHNGLKYYNLTNDGMPRLILAVGAVNDSADKSQISESTILLQDTTRHLKLNNVAMPVEFFAPRLTCLLDTHQFWMPIEYYLEPFGNLRMRIENAFPPETEYGYEMIFLTRTV